MQRSILRWITRLAVCMALGGVLVSASARAAQPIKVTAVALQRDASDPTGLTFTSVHTPLQPGDQFFYQFSITPKNDPQTPITLNATFDQRLEVLTIGTDGACVGLYETVHTLACRDIYGGIVQSRLSIVWVWFSVKASANNAPIIMTVTTPNDSKTITLAYGGARRLFLPIVRK